MKNSFLIYYEYKEHFEILSNEELGSLIRAIMEYETASIIPELSGTVKMAFSFIKSQLDRDKEKYNEETKKRSEAGKKGMQNRWNNKNNSVSNSDNKNNSVKSVITRDNTG